MAKETLEFDRNNLLPKDAYNKIKTSAFLEISPFRFRLQVMFESYSNLNKNTLKDMENKAEKAIDDRQKKIADTLNKLFDDVKKKHEADKKGDNKAYEEAKKLAKNAVNMIEEIADGLPPALREVVNKRMKESLVETAAKSLTKEKNPKASKSSAQTVGTWTFIGSYGGIRIKPGSFDNASKEEEAGAELAKALDAAKRNPGTYEFVLAESGDIGLVVRKHITGTDTRAAKEQTGGGKIWYGEIGFENAKNTYLFTLSKDCSASKGAELAKKIRAMVKNRCSKTIKVKVDDKDVADDEEADA
jgi:hypothetical protein